MSCWVQPSLAGRLNKEQTAGHSRLEPQLASSQGPLGRQAATPTPDCHSFPARQLLAKATGAAHQLETHGPHEPDQAEKEGRAERLPL